jgi:hypothetical protein
VGAGRADEVVVGEDRDRRRITPGEQSAVALLRAGLRPRHVEATLVRELGVTDDEAHALVAAILARKAS